ncbi:MAG: hypothetical protein GWO38_23215 [Phycisphaerae bacterium]|nr:hypothetical protein [Phycisphaerae bacterium]NIP54458.1 hypothetical protein [Phycisphaerae bacterium]NIX01522.1 hypothetical protein [Phycisphaerae bacterium]NIX30465.1 hypothetical protein [Phycisphaerae bacterium]
MIKDGMYFQAEEDYEYYKKHVLEPLGELQKAAFTPLIERVKKLLGRRYPTEKDNEA